MYTCIHLKYTFLDYFLTYSKKNIGWKGIFSFTEANNLVLKLINQTGMYKWLAR